MATPYSAASASSNASLNPRCHNAGEPVATWVYSGNVI